MEVHKNALYAEYNGEAARIKRDPVTDGFAIASAVRFVEKSIAWPKQAQPNNLGLLVLIFDHFKSSF